MSFEGFDREVFNFLDELTRNNERTWFEANKQRYEHVIMTPMLQFIGAMGEPLHDISPHFQAIPKRQGGSMFRIYRDVRFAKDKSPYKTHVAAQFRHQCGSDAHAPGFYFHFDLQHIIIGAGMWRPPSECLLKVRTAIAEQPSEWRATIEDHDFLSSFQLTGDALKRAPKGFPTDHEQIEDIKRKDFVAICEWAPNELLEPNLVERVAAEYNRAAPMLRFLCGALDVSF